MDRRSFLGLVLAAPALPYVKLQRVKYLYWTETIQLTDPAATFTRGELRKVASQCTYGPAYQ